LTGATLSNRHAKRAGAGNDWKYSSFWVRRLASQAANADRLHNRCSGDEQASKRCSGKDEGDESGSSMRAGARFPAGSFKKMIDFALEPEPLQGVYTTGRSGQKRNVLNNLRRYNWHVRVKIDGCPVTCFDLVNERLREALRA
jgi:hypothetical protein